LGIRCPCIGDAEERGEDCEKGYSRH
jgi:hypothetical protein